MAIASKTVVIGAIITICMNYGISNVDACVIINTAAAVKLFVYLNP